ncbi:MAG: hypothetical protein KJ737_04385 [Proteobacteria bacterium]|nr:hypothetical protein [Pseudomonadota bacterium]
MKKLLIIWLMCLMAMPTFGDPMEDAKKDGKKSANDILQEINTAGEINKKISVPLTDDAVPLQTLSKTNPQLIDVALTNESTDAFLEVTGSLLWSGDMEITVKADFGFTGYFTQTYAVPFIVSGVCTNGFISCLPADWSFKKYFLWTVDDKMLLEITPGGSQHLAGCYCINNSCGGIDDTQSILETIGGAIVGAVQTRNPRLTVTKVEATKTSIRFFGQDSSETKSLLGTYYGGPDKPEKLYSKTNDKKLNDATEAVVKAQSASPESYYNSLYATFSEVQKPVSIDSCLIKRTINLSPSPNVVTNDTCATIDPFKCQLMSESICDYEGNNCVWTYQSYNPTSYIPNTSCKTIGSYTFCNNGSQITDNSYGTILTGTGIWYHIERRYQCQDESDYDFETTLTRAANVTGSTTLTGDTVSYTDLTNYTFKLPTDNDFEPCEKACKILRIAEGTDVTKSGKVSDYRQDTTIEIGNNPVTVKYNESLEYTYVPCEKDEFGKEVCAIDPDLKDKNYEIIEACKCIDTFNTAISALQSVKFASKDMICSKK